MPKASTTLEKTCKERCEIGWNQIIRGRISLIKMQISLNNLKIYIDNVGYNQNTIDHWQDRNRRVTKTIFFENVRKFNATTLKSWECRRSRILRQLDAGATYGADSQCGVPDDTTSKKQAELRTVGKQNNKSYKKQKLFEKMRKLMQLKSWECRRSRI